jgi:hypothetical protein
MFIPYRPPLPVSIPLASTKCMSVISRFSIKAESELIFAILALHLQFVYRFAAVHGPPLFSSILPLFYLSRAKLCTTGCSLWYDEINPGYFRGYGRRTRFDGQKHQGG